MSMSAVIKPHIPQNVARYYYFGASGRIYRTEDFLTFTSVVTTGLLNQWISISPVDNSIITMGLRSSPDRTSLMRHDSDLGLIQSISDVSFNYNYYSPVLSNNGVLGLATYNNGLTYRSTDNASTWQSFNHNALSPNNVNGYNDIPGGIYNYGDIWVTLPSSILNVGNVHISTDNGISWSAYSHSSCPQSIFIRRTNSRWISIGMSGGTGMGIYTNDNDVPSSGWTLREDFRVPNEAEWAYDGNDTILITSEFAGYVIRSLDGGLTWSLVQLPYAPYNSSYRANLHYDGKYFYAVYRPYVIRSTNGVDWEVVYENSLTAYIFYSMTSLPKP